MQSRRPARAQTFSNCERGRMTPVLLDHEYSRGGHSALSIHFFLTLSGEVNTQTHCGRTGTSRHEDTYLPGLRKTKQNQSFHRVEAPTNWMRNTAAMKQQCDEEQSSGFDPKQKVRLLNEATVLQHHAKPQTVPKHPSQWRHNNIRN